MATESHILVVPFPSQGHISPMLEFSKRLISKGGIKVTLITSTTALTSMHLQANTAAAAAINIEAISDGYEDGDKDNHDEFLQRFQTVFQQNLSKFIENRSSSPYPVKFLIYDSAMPWTLEVARRLGLDGAPFLTQSCAVTSIYYLYHRGGFQIPSRGSAVVSLPSMPLLGFDDLPGFIHETASFPVVRSIVFNQFSNIEEPSWLFCNTFDKLEDETVKWMGTECGWPVKTIGPTIPSIYLDKRLEDDKDYGMSLFKPKTDACIQWLDSKESNSVVYVSFGSIAALGEDQMVEIASGLKRSNSHFLWVVRESEEKKLPKNFIEETSDKGLIVSWSPQLQVLAHSSVGCFVTHCGWNSTLEALSTGVPMVAMPQWTDQTTNAKFVAHVWEVGVRVKVNDDKGLVTREEIEGCVREIMEGRRGKEIRKNSEKWKELAKQAVDDGGSSDNNIDDFVKKLATI